MLTLPRSNSCDSDIGKVLRNNQTKGSVSGPMSHDSSLVKTTLRIARVVVGLA
jgi:hypothetical protein